MINKLIKIKIENLIKDTRDLKIADAITYIKSIFPENEFGWENIYKNYEYYYEHRDIVHLTNHTDLIISYPGGDRFGDKLSEPYTNIYFSNLKLTKKDDRLKDELNLFLDDKYYTANKISDYMNELSSNDNLSIEEIIMHLNTDINIPNHILKQLSDEQLQNTEVKEAIIKCVEKNTFERYCDAYDQYQYQYDRYGGEDVDEWKLSESLEFKEIWENLPDRVKQNCNEELEKAWLQIPNTKNILNEEKQELQQTINILYLINSEQDAIRCDIHNRYELLRKYDSYLSDNLNLKEKISLLWWNCLENIDEYLAVSNNYIEELNISIDELNIENKVLKDENKAIQQRRYHFWQKKEKNIAQKCFVDNLDKINKNNENLTALTEQLNKSYKEYDIEIQLNDDIDTMIKNNPIKNINLLYENFIFDARMSDLSNFSEKEYIGLINDAIVNSLSELETINSRITVLNDKLSKIDTLKSYEITEKGTKNNMICDNEQDFEIEL